MTGGVPWGSRLPGTHKCMRGVDCTRTTGYQGKDETEHSKFFSSAEPRLCWAQVGPTHRQGTPVRIYDPIWGIPVAFQCLSISRSQSKHSRVLTRSSGNRPCFLHWVRTRCKLALTGLDHIGARLRLTRRSASDLHPGDPWPPPPPLTNLPAGDQKGGQVLIQAKPPLLLKVCGISQVGSATSAWIISFNNQTTRICFPSPCSAFFSFCFFVCGLIRSFTFIIA